MSNAAIVFAVMGKSSEKHSRLLERTPLWPTLPQMG
jgi:hypothetical protein